MKVVFIIQETEDEQLGIMYLSSALKAGGHQTELVKADYGQAARRLNNGSLSIVAYSTIAFYADWYLRLNRQIKKNFNTFSVFGGHYPTGQPEMIEQQGVDAVCVGEGEAALLELANNLDKGKDIRQIKNFWVKHNGKIYKNTPRPLIDDLDRLRFPDRSLFKRKSPFFYDRISVITSRGCVYSCPYCYNSTYRKIYGIGDIYRRRSVDNVLEEIKQCLTGQRVRFILFYDDIFIIGLKWLYEFSRKYREQIHIPFFCYVRINLATPQIVRLLKEAGCYSISFGVETGSDRLRNEVLKRGMSKEEIVSLARLFKDAGIKIRTTNIIGIPGGSLNDDIETLKLNVKCKVTFAKVSMFSAYPKTDFQDSRKRYGEPAMFAKHRGLPPRGALKVLGKCSANASGHFQRILFSLDTPYYGFRDERERRHIANLHKIFAFTVSFPFLLPAARLAISLPLRRLFVWIKFIWTGYCSYFKLYPTCGFAGFIKRIFVHGK